jgi:hypothetical protein
MSLGDELCEVRVFGRYGIRADAQREQVLIADGIRTCRTDFAWGLPSPSRPLNGGLLARMQLADGILPASVLCVTTGA